jgi:uncharacterized membrane protein YedE/YeeE
VFGVDTPPFWIAGLAFGGVVVLLRWMLNERIGVLGGYSELVEVASRRSSRLGWKAFFLVGVALGGLAFALIGGRFDHSRSYGWIGRAFPAHAVPATVVALLVGGVLVGYGAKTAGGCTSGNGFGGTTSASPASFVATATFFSTAVGVSFLLRALFGG